MELRDAAVEGFLLGGIEVRVSAASATAVVPSSSLEKGGFNLREEFFDLVVFFGGGLGVLVKSPLDNLISVNGGGGQEVEVGVKFLG